MPFFHRDSKDSNILNKSSRRARSLANLKNKPVPASSPLREDSNENIPQNPPIPEQHSFASGAAIIAGSTTMLQTAEDNMNSPASTRLNEPQVQAAEYIRAKSPSLATVRSQGNNGNSYSSRPGSRSNQRNYGSSNSPEGSIRSLQKKDQRVQQDYRNDNYEKGEQYASTRKDLPAGLSDCGMPEIPERNRSLANSDTSINTVIPNSPVSQNGGRSMARPLNLDVDGLDDNNNNQFNSTRYVILSPSRFHHNPAKLSISTNNSASNYDDGQSYGRPSYDIRDQDQRESVTPSFVTGRSSAPSTPPLEKGESYMPQDEFHSYDLLPPTKNSSTYSLEDSSVRLFSSSHLEVIFASPTLLNKFVKFVATHRPLSCMQVLIYYFDALKALKAIKYANAVQESLQPIAGLLFTEEDPSFPLKSTFNRVLEARAADAFLILAEQELPRYITWVYVEIITHNIAKKITGQLPTRMKESVDALAEVFCLTDPSRPDNPIIFASEEFHRTTQYGVDYVVNRNCRFLQGPKTNRHSTARLRDAIKAGKEVSEVFLNYRRDGSPFMNLLMCAPLCDSRGNVRYFLGAQVDVSQLVKDGMGLESFKRLEGKEIKGEQLEVERMSLRSSQRSHQKTEELKEFADLAELFGPDEIEIVRTCGGRMHRERDANEVQTGVGGTKSNAGVLNHGIAPKARVVIKAGTPPAEENDTRGPSSYWNASLRGVYKNYLLVRPYPSLRILFSSPSLRTPGILQSPFLSKIGGSPRMRDELENALMDGRGVTAKVRWLSRREDRDVQSAGRERWIHATPLLADNGAVGVWMVVLLDEDKSRVDNDPTEPIRSPTISDAGARRFRDAPVIGRPEEWRNRRGQYDDIRGYDRNEVPSRQGMHPQRGTSRAGYSDQGSGSLRSLGSKEDLTL